MNFILFFLIFKCKFDFKTIRLIFLFLCNKSNKNKMIATNLDQMIVKSFYFGYYLSLKILIKLKME